MFKVLGMKEDLLIAHQCDSTTKHSSDPLAPAQELRAYHQQGSDTLSQYPSTGEGKRETLGCICIFQLHSTCQSRTFWFFSPAVWNLYSNVGLCPCCKSKAQRLLITERSIFQYWNGRDRKDKQHKDDLRLTLTPLIHTGCVFACPCGIN